MSLLVWFLPLFDTLRADLELGGLSRESSDRMRTLMTSRVSFVSSTVLITDDVKEFHSRVFRRVFRRMKARTLWSMLNFIPASRVSSVWREAIWSEMGEVPSQAEAKSCRRSEERRVGKECA